MLAEVEKSMPRSLEILQENSRNPALAPTSLHNSLYGFTLVPRVVFVVRRGLTRSHVLPALRQANCHNQYLSLTIAGWCARSSAPSLKSEAIPSAAKRPTVLRPSKKPS